MHGFKLPRRKCYNHQGMQKRECIFTKVKNTPLMVNQYSLASQNNLTTEICRLQYKMVIFLNLSLLSRTFSHAITKSFAPTGITATKVARVLHPYRMHCACHRTFPRAKQMSTGHLLSPVCALVPLFQVQFNAPARKSRVLSHSAFSGRGTRT